MHLDLLATRAAGIEPTVYQRGRGIGGSSAVNAMVALRGNEELYRSWGWNDLDTAWARGRPSKRRRSTTRTRPGRSSPAGVGPHEPSKLT